MSEQTASVLGEVMPGVQGIAPYEPGRTPEAITREYGVAAPIKLASNENPLGASPRAMDAARRALADLGRYPDGGAAELKARLAQHLSVDASMLTLGNGSNEVLEFVAQAFLGPGRSAVMSEHSFAVYGLATRAVGATVVAAPANPETGPQPYGHDLEAMAAAVRADTRVVFIANPNNPTGTFVEGARLESFIRALPAHVVVVVDEAYCEYVEAPGYPNALAWLDRFPNLVVARTFSKVYGLAALRVGFAVSRPEVAEVLNRIRPPFNVNQPAQAAACAALDDAEFVAESVRLNHQGLAYVSAALAERGLSAIPSVANFVCVDVAGPAGPVFEALLRAGVIVRPVGGYGLPRHLRISIGRPEENHRLIAALDRVLAL